MIPLLMALPYASRTLSAKSLGRVRRDDGLRPAPRRRVGEGLADAREGEARGDQRPDAHLRHQRQRAAKRGAAAEGADDLDLAVVQVPEAQRNLAALRAHAHELE